MYGRVGVSIAAAALLAACGGAREKQFPTREELAQLARTPPPATKRDPAHVVDEWTLAGPFPDALGEQPGAAPGPAPERLRASGRVQTRLLHVTADMECAARELGRFHLAHGAPPTEHLKRFIAGRCGSPDGHLATQWLSGAMEGAVDDATVVERWGPQIDEMVASLVGTRAAGLWLGRDGEKAVVLLASRSRLAWLEPRADRPDEDGHVRLTGELLTPAASLSAVANHGAFGTAHCVEEPGVALPRFAFRCPVAAEDESAWVAIHAFPPGRFLGTSVVEVLVWPAGGRTPTYTAPKRTADRVVSGATALGEAFVEGVNEVRTQAKRAPLVLDIRQSLMAAEIAPVFFAGADGEDRLVADRIALGMMAGWDVEASVLEGRFTAELGQAADVARLLEVMLDRPGTRDALMSHQAGRIAVGSVLEPETQAAGVIVGTYSVLDHANVATEARRLAVRLNEARLKRGSEAVARLAQVEGDAAGLRERLKLGRVEPSEAMDELMKMAVRRLNAPVRGWVFETGDPAELELPVELLAPKRLRAALLVAPYKDPEQPWARYVVLVVTSG